MKHLMTGIALSLVAGGAAWAVENEMNPAATVTRAEAQTKATERFAMMDANKDGKLDSADRAARHAAMFDMIDANKDGQISRAEFDAHHAAMRDGRGMRGHEGHGEGHGAGHGGGMMKHAGRGGGMGRMADTDGNGSVTQAEFMTAAMARFDQADANKDGSVTPEERRNARQAMRERWRASAAAPKSN